MSKLLIGLTEVERKGRQPALAEDASSVSGHYIDRQRTQSEIDAEPTHNVVRNLLSVRRAAALPNRDHEALAGATQRVSKEEQVPLAARSKMKTEIAGISALAVRLAVEGEAKEALHDRIKQESEALEAARRRERSAADLATTASACAANELNWMRIAQERAIAERRAADRAEIQLQAELAAEAAIMARVAAQENATQQVIRREALEAEVSRLADERVRLERVLSLKSTVQPDDESNPVLGLYGESCEIYRIGRGVNPPDDTQETSTSQTGSLTERRYLPASIFMSIAIAVTAGYWLGRQGEPMSRTATSLVIPPVAGASANLPPLSDEDFPSLRLDHGLRIVPVAEPVAAGKS